MTGHSPAVYSEHYARPFRDAEEREKVRKSLASIGFGNTPVDQPVDQRSIWVCAVSGWRTKSPAQQGPSRWSVPGSNR
jgi:hypothetical protein